MVAESIAALIVFIIFLGYLGLRFLVPIFDLLVNGVFIYGVFLRAHVEIVKEKKYYFYLAGAVSSIVVYALAGNVFANLRFWSFTTWLFLAMVFSQIGIAGHNFYKKHNKKSR